VLTWIDRLKGSLEEWTQPFIRGDRLEDKALWFVFKCRGEDWLRAEGLIRKHRHQRGELELVEDLEVEPLPKPELTEEEIYANGFSTDGVGGVSNTGSSQSQSPTPPSYIGKELGVWPGEKAPRISQPLGEERLQPPPSDSITSERPRKVPRHSRNSMLAIDGEARQATTTVHSVHQSSVEDGSRSGVKTEGSGLPNMKIEEAGSAQGLKEEVWEGKIGKLTELKVCVRPM